ncbi:DNA polymerase I [Allostella humosa]|nr:DNA polymerase I [Stella humosa]
MRHLYLVDGSGFIFRAFHALPPLTRADGTPVGAVLGFSNMLLKLLGETDADAVAVIFDASRYSFRNAIYDAYKAQRPDAPPELIPQFPLVREATEAFNLPGIESDGYEADDIIATYARAAQRRGIEVTIVSSDKDLMQLVDDGIRMLDPIKNKAIGPDEVREKFGVAPDRVVDVQALAGDSVDNVPGVPGIGVKTAAELINTYGDLDQLLARAGEIKQPKRRESLIQHADLARVSRELVRLKDDVPDLPPLEALAVRPADPNRLVEFLRTQNFRTLLSRVESRNANRAAATAALAPVAAADAQATSAEGGAAAPMPAATAANYVLIQDLDVLDAWIARATAAGAFAVDTETTSLDAVTCELVGVSLSIEPGEGAYLPLAHKVEGLDLTGGAPRQIDRDTALARLKPLLEDPAVLKIGHNLKYDAVVLGRHGIQVAPADDTMLLSYVLDGHLHGHGMDELALLHLAHKTIAFADVCGTGKNQITFDLVPLDRARDYAAEDAEVTLRLHRLLRPRLLKERQVALYETTERPLAPVIAAMERAGIKVDPVELKRLSRDFGERLAVLETEIHRLAGRPFNVGSPKQLGEVLFDEMSLAGGKKGKTGAYATGAEVLEVLAAQGHALPARVLDWRQLAKLKSTYADALVEQINPATGRVHTSYALASTSTGRLSSTDPNLQNIPVRTEEGRKIRRAFIAEDGHVLMSADYSQIELRLAAHVADIPSLKDAFRQGIDIHALTASQVFGVPVEGMDPQVRRRAKAINFGIIYGISGFGLAQQLGIPQGEAQAYIAAYFERYPGIRAYMDRTKQLAREQGYVTTIFGRRCWVPGIKDSNPARRAFAERQAINAPLQGSAADIIKRAMARIPAALTEAGLSATMLLQVHDELIFEVREAEVEATAALVRRVMEGAAHISVPLVVDTGVGRDWETAH